MALALAESLLDCNPLDGADLARRFCAWIAADPPDAGIQTRLALGWIESGLGWEQATRRMERERPDSAGNNFLTLQVVNQTAVLP
jgi:ADP-ribosyl-[dinitrogen reductase] hydrolase